MSSLRRTSVRSQQRVGPDEVSTQVDVPRLDVAERRALVAAELRRVARVARIPRPSKTGGGGFAAQLRDRVFIFFVKVSFVIVFIVPSSIGAIYYGLVADNQYITEARFMVQSGSSSISLPQNLMSLLGSGQEKDAQIVVDFIKSRTLLDQLQQKIDLKQMFRAKSYDFYSHVQSNPSMESLVEYWRHQIDVSVSSGSGLIYFSVRAFDPADSLAIARGVVELSEKAVNQLTRFKELDEFRHDSEELDRARGRLTAAVGALRDARNAAGLLDVDVAAKVYGDILTTLRLQATQIDQSLDVLAQSHLTTSPQIGPLKAQSQAIHAQIKDYEDAIAGRSPGNDVSGDTLATRSAQLVERETDLSIARNEYASAAATFESSRVALERQRAYLLVYVQPQLAEKALYPRRITYWLEIFVASFILWAWLAGSAVLIRDNMA